MLLGWILIYTMIFMTRPLTQNTQKKTQNIKQKI